MFAEDTNFFGSDSFTPESFDSSDITEDKTILPRESLHLEYKRERPKDPLKYLKTVIAFANGDGGKLIFGVDDNSREPVGISGDEISSEMDAIANCIADSCTPVIHPRLQIMTVGDKMLIICTISSGTQTPFYITSLGMHNGVYVRVGASSRNASESEIRELLARGMNLTPDQIEYPGVVLTEDEVDRMCKDLTNYASSIGTGSRPVMTRERLIAMHIILFRNDKLLPTYAYNILAGIDCSEIMMNIQCGVFKGTERGFPIDSLECSGPIYRQIDQAMQFILRSIRVKYEVRDRAQRYEIPEFPMNAIRELLCNAVCHRSYLMQSHVQVALYDDRLEITSPGMLPSELTLDDIRRGMSIIRNRSLSDMFRYLGIMEQWGLGIPNAIKICRDHGLREPELKALNSAFIVTIYRKDPILPVRQEPEA